MNIKHQLTVIAKLGIGLTAVTLLLAGCGGGGGGGGGGGSASSSGGTVTGVATPSKVSVVNTN